MLTAVLLAAFFFFFFKESNYSFTFGSISVLCNF